MPTFYDIFSLEDVDIEDDSANFYIIRVGSKYKFCATSQDLNSLAMQAGDPETRIKFYWPINRIQLNQADLDALFPNDKIKTKLMTIEELEEIFRFNPIEQVQQCFGPESPQNLVLDILQQVGVSTEENRNLVTNHDNLGGIYTALSALQHAGILTQNNFDTILNYTSDTYTDSLADFAQILSSLQEANLLTQVNFETISQHLNRDYFYPALLCLIEANILTPNNISVLSNHFVGNTYPSDRAHMMYYTVALENYALAGLLTQQNFNILANLNFRKTAYHFFVLTMTHLREAALLNANNIRILMRYTGNDSDIFALWQKTKQLARDNLLTQDNFIAITNETDPTERHDLSTNAILRQLNVNTSTTSNTQRSQLNSFSQIETKIQKLASTLHIPESNFIDLDASLIEELHQNENSVSELIHEYKSITLGEIVEQPLEIREKMYMNANEVAFLRQYLPLEEIVTVSQEKCMVLHLIAPLLICHKITSESLNELPIESVYKLGILSLYLINGNITQEIANSFLEDPSLQQIIQFTPDERSRLHECFNGMTLVEAQGEIDHDQMEQELQRSLDELGQSARTHVQGL